MNCKESSRGPRGHPGRGENQPGAHGQQRVDDTPQKDEQRAEDQPGEPGDEGERKLGVIDGRLPISELKHVCRRARISVSHMYIGMDEPASDWWRTWFGPGYLALYDDTLGERTPIEIDQLEALLQLRPPLRILDLPCGQGRHAIELARRGYEVTGVDLSPYLIGVAKARAEAGGVKVRWLEGDMRRPVPGERFDLVLNLFTSLGYFLDEADDRLVVQAAADMLGPGGRFLLEVINGERLMGHFVEREWFTVGQAAVMERRSLDRSARRMIVERTVSRPGRDEVNVHALRLYGAREIESMLRASGFDRIELYGDWAGGPVSAESLRVLAVGVREKEKGGS